MMVVIANPEATGVLDPTRVANKMGANSVATGSNTELFPTKVDTDEKKSNTMKWVWIGIAGLIIILGSSTGYLIFGSNSSFVEEEKVAVPSNLEGLNKEEVEYALKSAGLVMKIGQPKYSETVAKDKFVSSSPKSGTKVKKGSVVTVYFSAGPEENTMLDVSNMGQAEAIARLKEIGLELEKVIVEDNGTVEEGKVIRTVPAAGEKVVKGSKFQLYVSSGRIIVPNSLVGKSKDEVTKYLSDNGLNFEIISVATDQEAPGTVLSISPAGVVSRGTPIKVVVAADPGPKQSTPDPDTDSSTVPSPPHTSN